MQAWTPGLVWKGGKGCNLIAFIIPLSDCILCLGHPLSISTDGKECLKLNKRLFNLYTTRNGCKSSMINVVAK